MSTIQINESNSTSVLSNHIIDLDDDEKILWQGKPIKNIYIHKNWRFLIGGIFWAIVILAFEVMAIYHAITNENGNWGMVVYGLFLMFPVAYLLFGHHLVMTQFWKNEYYYLSNKKAYLFKGFRTTKLYTHRLDGVEMLEKEVVDAKYKGAMTIHLVYPGTIASNWGLFQRFRRKRLSSMEAPKFVGVDNAEEVYNITQKAITDSRKCQ